MQDIELINIWKSYDQKLEKTITINQELTKEVALLKVDKLLGNTGRVKTIVLLIGIPFLVLLYAVTSIGIAAAGIFFTIGFGAISIITTIVVVAYIYHLYIINQIEQAGTVAEVQKKLASLKISGFNATKIAILQIPFWQICWISYDAIISSPSVYGVINLSLAIVFTLVTVWIYKNLSVENKGSKLNQFFFSGVEWEPLEKSADLLEQIKEFE